jgi:hypothetical protein
MDGGYDLPNFLLIFAGAILLGSLPTILIIWYMLKHKVDRPKFDETQEKYK